MDSLIIKLTGSANSIMRTSENHLLKDWLLQELLGIQKN